MRIHDAKLVCHEFTDQGIAESGTAFGSLEELSALCLGTMGSKLPERIVMHVIDDDGRSCTLALSFASVVRSPDAD